MPNEKIVATLQVGDDIPIFVQGIDREVVVHIDIHIPKNGPTSILYGSVRDNGTVSGREVIIRATRTSEGFCITAATGHRRTTRWVSA